MIYCFDLDGTLCTNTNGDYKNASPFLNRISHVNSLYDDNTIIISTARGVTTGKNWFDFTEEQLKNWKVKYHTLYVGEKIHADLFIDDKGISDIDFFKNKN